MIPQRVESAMSEQFTVEMNSFYAYLAMSAYCDAQALPGFAHWLRLQSNEELEHAMRFYSFVGDRGGRVHFEQIDRPTESYGSLLELFETALANEEAVTKSINDLYALTVDERDYASQAFLDWFLTEQVEEEKVVGDVVRSLRRIGDRGDALFLLDKELAGRTARG